ncbi:hypothetical protein KBB45_09280 [Myxococcota bacterium]|nr:hypothetical protein [Myxococcota bacterium]HHW96233.1 hypothetical protein [Oligoflexales bacterium]
MTTTVQPPLPTLTNVKGRYATLTHAPVSEPPS